MSIFGYRTMEIEQRVSGVRDASTSIYRGQDRFVHGTDIARVFDGAKVPVDERGFVSPNELLGAIYTQLEVPEVFREFDPDKRLSEVTRILATVNLIQFVADEATGKGGYKPTGDTETVKQVLALL